VLAATALGGWIARDAVERRTSGPADPGATGTASTPTSPMTSGSRPAVPGRAAVDPSTAPAAVQAPQPRPTAQAASAPVEVCGVGPVAREAVDAWHPGEGADPPWQQALDRRANAVRSRLAARLAVGAHREQVAARLLMDDVEGAVSMAALSPDAVAYRLALQSCQRQLALPACQGLSVQRWAQLDPADARPWLWLASAARGSRDEAAATEAVEQVLQRHVLSRENALLDVVLGARDAVDDREKVDAAIGAYRAGGLGVAGPDRTLLALTNGQVDELLITASLSSLGELRNSPAAQMAIANDASIKDAAVPATAAGEPAQAGAETVRLSDELVTRAQQTGARVSFIEDPALLEPYGGVAATLRYRV